MSDEHAERWPHFQIMTYSHPTGIPNGWDEELLEKGAPDGLVCHAARELTLIEDPNSGPLVCFGTTGLHVCVCLDPRAKQVVDIVVHEDAETGKQQPKVIRSAWLVNSSLDQFIASVRAVTARLPFDSEGSGEDCECEELTDRWAYEDRITDEWDRAGRELTGALRHIDPAAVANPDGFWMTFVADVQMGDYSTSDLLNLPDSRCNGVIRISRR